MNIASITRLKELRDSIKKAKRGIKPADYDGQKFGPESEYTVKSLLGGLNALLVDMTTLVNSPAKFIKISSHAQRVQLANVLSNINTSVTSRDLTSLATHIDQLKPLLACYGVRHSDDRLQEFDKQLDALQRKATELSLGIDQLQEANQQATEINSGIEDVHESLQEKLKALQAQEEHLAELIATTEQHRQSVDSLLEEDKERSETIRDLLSDARSHKETIEGFSKRVAQREGQLEAQEVKTKRYLETLSQWETERQGILEEADALIESARTAMEYKTAEGLSAAFIDKTNEAKKTLKTQRWIEGALGFVLLAVGIGVWIFWGKSAEFHEIIGRLSMIPILLGGAWFCAGQYVKQRNIAEDYAYKSVLAKSMVGFADQLSDLSKKGDDYSHFIKSVLAQIHKDPLRNHSMTRGEHSSDTGELAKILESLPVLRTVVEKIDNIPGAGK